MQVVRSELLGTRVFVFTEGGRILNLARGATLADAAAVLRVPLDSQSGFVCNHNMCEAVSLDSVLSNGDIVCFAPSLDRLGPGLGLGLESGLGSGLGSPGRPAPRPCGRRRYPGTARRTPGEG